MPRVADLTNDLPPLASAPEYSTIPLALPAGNTHTSATDRRQGNWEDKLWKTRIRWSWSAGPQ